MNKIGIIIGHNEKSQGAVNYFGESEWAFNSKVATLMSQHLFKERIEAMILKRPSGVGYSNEVRTIVTQCSELGLEHAISLHFNAASGNPKGCECLIPAGADPTFAKRSTDLLNERLGIKERGVDGVKEIKERDRGAGMLYGLQRAGVKCSLIEPCFSNKSNESEKIFTNPNYYALLLSIAIKSSNYYTVDENSSSYRVESEKLLQEIREKTYRFYLKWNP